MRRGASAALIVLAAACGSQTSPNASYAGVWTGTTAQGEAISFTISSSEAVTAITVGYSFNGCRGSQRFENLNISIVPQVTCIPGPCSPSITTFRQFGYASGNPLQDPSTQVNGLFLSTSSAEGSANFRNFVGCGDAIGVAWTATRTK